MKLTTKRIHADLERLGVQLGFEVDLEVSKSLFGVVAEGDYNPRLDVLWSLPLEKSQGAALAALLESKTAPTHIPVVGIEIEGTTPSTKTLQSDVTNLAAMGVPFGLLVVSENGERGIYRRAARALRTLRWAFGDLRVAPVEASWIPPLLKKRWTNAGAQPVHWAAKKPAGGEGGEWTPRIRKQLRRRGSDAGFEVGESYVPPVVLAEFERGKGLCGDRFTHLYDPLGQEVRPISNTKDWLTNAEIDLVWALPLPTAFAAFLVELCRLDPHTERSGLLHPRLWSHLIVAAFELESSHGKHAHGSFLNLAAHSEIGTVVVSTDLAKTELDRALRTCAPTLGLRNVLVRKMP